MARWRWALISVGIVALWVLAVDSFAGVTPPVADKSNATNQVQQGKQPAEDDVQSRGLFSKKKKKKKANGGAAARSQPSDRTDSTSGNLIDRVMP